MTNDSEQKGPRFCKFCGDTVHNANDHPRVPGPWAPPMWCEYCHGHYNGDSLQHEKNCTRPTEVSASPAPWLEFGPNTTPNPGTYLVRISSKDKAYMEWRDNKWLWDSGDGEPIQDFTAQVTHYKPAAQSVANPPKVEAHELANKMCALRFPNERIHKSRWNEALAWAESALAILRPFFTPVSQPSLKENRESFIGQLALKYWPDLKVRSKPGARLTDSNAVARKYATEALFAAFDAGIMEGIAVNDAAPVTPVSHGPEPQKTYEQGVIDAEQREIAAIREGYKAEICRKCETVLLAHKHFLRCNDSACPMKDGKGSILDQLAAPPEIAPTKEKA